MQHLYKVGQMLEMRSAPRHGRSAGTCEVISCLPHERGPLLYRVKPLNENNERVVDEIDLAPSSAIKSSDSEGERLFSITIDRR